MHTQMRKRPLFLAAALLAAAPLLSAPEDILAATLEPATLRAWERYFTWADAAVEREIGDAAGRFLHLDQGGSRQRDEIRRRLASGEIVVARVSGVVPAGTRFEVPDGEIHHLRGTVLVRGVTLPALVEFLQDYDHHAGKFEDVEVSRLLSRSGNTYRFHFRLRRTKAIVTAYYNTDQECIYRSHGSSRVSSRSIATRIAELRNPGTPDELELPPGKDRGFLWRLVSWWRFEQVPEGVIVECESASLSRDIPAILKLIPGVSSYIRSTPGESLSSVLNAIRANAPRRPVMTGVSP